MRSVLLLAPAFLLAACVTPAPTRSADPGPPAITIFDVADSDEAAEAFVDDLDERLAAEGHALADAQRRELFVIFVEGAGAHRALLAEYRAGRAEGAPTRQGARAAHERVEARLATALTAEQFAGYRRLFEERIARLRG